MPKDKNLNKIIRIIYSLQMGEDPIARAEILEVNEARNLLGKNNQLHYAVEQQLPSFWQH